MPDTPAINETQNPQGYLQQLYEHSAHKVEVEFTPEVDIVSLPFRTCHLSASVVELVLKGTSTPSALPRLERFLDDHAERFAFRKKTSRRLTPNRKRTP